MDAEKKENLQRFLRRETHALHMRMHEHSFLLPLQDNTVSFAEYINILRGFYAFYAKWENHFSRSYLTFENELMPLSLLRRDFDILNINVPPAHPEVTEPTDSFSSYVGYLYVKQGSTLGGQIIGGHIRKHLHLTPQKELFYFDGYGKDTGKNWRDFRFFLQQWENDVDWSVASHMARNIFKDMDRTFTKLDKMKGQAA